MTWRTQAHKAPALDRSEPLLFSPAYRPGCQGDVRDRIGGEGTVARKARLLRRSAVLAALATAFLGGSASANHSGKDLITIGPAGGNGVQNAFFDATSTDGSVAVFETAESLVPSDTDTAYDIY